MFFSCISPEPNSGCWLWTAAVNACGYGILAGKIGLAHRFSFALHRGPIPIGMNVLHRCDVPCCVNPDHLFVGTQRDNILDMENKKRSYHPSHEQHGRAKLTWDNVRNIRRDHRSASQIARDFGVTKTNILAIKRNAIWQESEA